VTLHKPEFLRIGNQQRRGLVREYDRSFRHFSGSTNFMAEFLRMVNTNFQ
jgi:hypothetical protein